jgi:hypothetical protein
MDIVRPTTNSKRPAVKKAVKKLRKGIATKDGQKIQRGFTAVDKTVGVSKMRDSSNTTKKLTKRVNQSLVAKGKKPQERYIAKSRRG